MKKLLKLIRNKKGQALIEFLLFVPFMFMLYLVILNYFSAINGSINQQKATRNYFYARLKGNSFAPYRFYYDALEGKIQQSGIMLLGYSDYLEGENPVAVCYQVKTIGSTSKPDKCVDKSYSDVNYSSFVRPKTVYGLCGVTINIGSQVMVYDFKTAGSAGSCTIR